MVSSGPEKKESVQLLWNIVDVLITRTHRNLNDFALYTVDHGLTTPRGGRSGLSIRTLRFSETVLSSKLLALHYCIDRVSHSHLKQV